MNATNEFNKLSAESEISKLAQISTEELPEQGEREIYMHGEFMPVAY